MKNTHHNKALIIAAALTVGCSSISGTLPVRAAAEQTAVCETAAEPVKVIVRLVGSAVLSLPEAEAEGTSFLDGEKACEAEASIKEQQAAVEESIRALYPELEVHFHYTLLTNGFSCKLPESLIPAVESIPGVERVERVTNIEVPQLQTASELCGVEPFRNDTGCTGEGQVIAVIDSELDVTHPMFSALPEDIETTLDKDQVADIINSGSFNMDVDPERAYISSKLPYVIDYVDDPYDGVPNRNSYHGTHVCGIAAGNKFTTDSGKELSGIARDAQIIFMACGLGGYGLDGEAGAAAIEDAVRLHADVINMSWGTSYETNEHSTLSDMMKVADNAGVTICSSAGNSDNGANSVNRLNTVEIPDVGTVSTKYYDGDGGILVASADNAYQSRRGVLKHGDTELLYRPKLSSLGNITYMTDELPWKTFEYVYASFNAVQGSFDADINGRILLTDRGSSSFDSVAQAASDNGAVGVIFIDRSEGTPIDYICSDSAFPMGCITYEEGQMLINSEDKTLINDGTAVDESNVVKVSSYSSWGVRGSLDLRPDITGIGGKVESAGYESSTFTLSGTSMSSPYISGCAALLRQYLEKNGLAAEGREKVDIIRNMLMNSAEPLTENDMYVTPRRQGAGLAAMDKALQDKVIVTGDCGSAKINLYDKIGDTFSFNVHMDNISSEDVEFTNARLVLTTDDYISSSETDHKILSGQQPLSCSCDLSSLLSIGAGSSVTETVTASLDPQQSAELQKIFVNGFFVEGFIILEGADNCCDISVPLLGFHGDWLKLPIFLEDTIVGDITIGNDALGAGFSLGQELSLMRDIITRSAEAKFDKPIEYDPEDSFYLTELLFNDLTNEEISLLAYGDPNGEVWISPNCDGMADYFAGLTFDNKRQATSKGAVLDSEGNILWESEPLEFGFSEIFEDTDRESFMIIGLSDPLDSEKLEEGTYTFRLTSEIYNPGSAADPQIIEKQFKVDKTAPKLTAEEYQSGDRTILRLTADDSGALDCIFVIGNGKGFIAGSDPSVYSPPALQLVDILSKTHSPAYNTMIADTEKSDSALPIVFSRLNPSGVAGRNSIYDFSDFIPITKTDDGSFTVEYDITDLTDYTFTVIDKAYNYTSLESEHNSISTMPEGVWYMYDVGYLQFEGDQVRYLSLETAQPCTVPYELKDLMLTIDHPDFSGPMKLSFVSMDTIQAEMPDKGLHDMNKKWDYNSIDEIKLHPLPDFVERVKNEFVALTGIETATCNELENLEPQYFTIYFYYNDPETGDFRACYAMCSLITGIARYSIDGSVIKDLYSTPCTELQAGTYVDSNTKLYFTFLEDGRSGYILENGSYHAILPVQQDTPFTYTMDEKGNIEFIIDGSTYKAEISYDENRVLQMIWEHCYPYDKNFTKISDTPLLPEDHISDLRIQQLVKDYFKAVSDRYIDIYLGRVLENGLVQYPLDDSLYITIDPFTLKASINDSIAVDLRNIPALPEDSYSLEELRQMALEDHLSKHSDAQDAEYKEFSFINENGDVTVLILDEENNTRAAYTLDPVTATGTDQNDEIVNLPATGNNSPTAAAAASLAVLLLLVGTALIMYSCRKKKSA